MILVADLAQMDMSGQPDFAALKAAGFGVVIFRRSYCYYDGMHRAHRLAHDPTFERDAVAARAAGLVVGAYMFPSYKKGAPSPVEQVANFAAAGGELIPGIDLPPFQDVEFPGRGIADTGRSQAEVADIVLATDRELRRVFGSSGIYTSHVQTDDDNGLGGALARLPEGARLDLAEALLWQKIPYRLGAGHPLDQVAPRDPHEGRAAWDEHDYYRTPRPWEGRSGWWIRQWQGDARGLPGGLRQADVGDFRVARVGDHGSHVLGLKRRLQHLGGGRVGPLDVASPLFDEDLELAVRALQTTHNLDVDGVVGPRAVAAAWWPM